MSPAEKAHWAALAAPELVAMRAELQAAHGAWKSAEARAASRRGGFLPGSGLPDPELTALETRWSSLDRAYAARRAEALAAAGSTWEQGSAIGGAS